MEITARKLISSSTNIAKPIIDPRFGFMFQRWISMAGCENAKDSGKHSAAVWGNGDYGRLGLGNLESKWSPRILGASVFGNQNLREIACGGAHTLFLTENGNVYGTGLNDFGQLGISDAKSYTTNPLPVCGLPKEIIRISAGYHHSSAITVDGELYMWGKNSNGQLGLGKKAAKLVSLPRKVECLNGVTIRTTSLGCEHSVAVTDKGEALSWGGGGGLGHGHKSSILGFVKSSSEFTPRLIKVLEGVKVKSVAAGVLHSACIDENGLLYIFGERAKEKLGYEEEMYATLPSLISELPSSEEITSTKLNGGDLVRWWTLKMNGEQFSQLLKLLDSNSGMTAYILPCPYPAQAGFWVRLVWFGYCVIQELGTERKIGSAKQTGGLYLLDVPESQGGEVQGGRELYSWGSNDNGCLGIGSTDVAHSPERVKGPFLRNPVCKVSCGWKHTAAISGGKVYTWGWGGSHGTFSDDGYSSGGQLGQGNDIDYIEPTLVGFLSSVNALQVSCGFNHTGAILEYSQTRT